MFSNSPSAMEAVRRSAALVTHQIRGCGGEGAVGGSTDPVALRAAAAAARSAAASLDAKAAAIDLERRRKMARTAVSGTRNARALRTRSSSTPSTLQPSHAPSTSPQSALALFVSPRTQSTAQPLLSASSDDSSPVSTIGLSAAALRQVMLYSSVGTIASVTLVNKELRDQFAMCKEELVTKLLHLRSPRMAKVMKLATGMAGDNEAAADITQVYRDTVEVEQQLGARRRDAELPSFDLDKVIMSFELTTVNTKSQSLSATVSATVGVERRVESWAAPLGPIMKGKQFGIEIPPHIVDALGMPRPSADLCSASPDDDESDIYNNIYNITESGSYREEPSEYWVIHNLRVFMSAQKADKLRSLLIFEGDPESDDGDGVTYFEWFLDFVDVDPIYREEWHRLYPITMVHMDCKDDRATRKVRYEIRGFFAFYPEDHSDMYDIESDEEFNTFIQRLIAHM